MHQEINKESKAPAPDLLLDAFQFMSAEELGIVKSFSQHTVTEDPEVIKKVQQEKLAEKEKRMQFRNLWGTRSCKMSPTSQPYSVSQPYFERDAVDFIESAQRNPTTKANMQVICTHPLIVIYDNFLDDAECQWGIDCFNHESKHAYQGHFTKNGEDTGTKHRTARMITMGYNSDFSKMIREKLNTAFFQDSKQIKPDYIDSTILQHYSEGGFVAVHADYLSEKQRKLQEERFFTTLTYLNSCEEGGETTFPYIGVKIKPVKGRVVIWQNALCPVGSAITRIPDLLSQHAGCVVGKGQEKCIATNFVMSQPSREIYSEEHTRSGLPAKNKRKREESEPDAAPAKRLKETVN